jgi:hypothetical protein
VPEATRVGEQGGVEVRRHRGADRRAELAEQLVDHLARGAGARVDEVDGPERGVAEMVVDVDNRGGTLDLGAALAEPTQGCAVEREDRVAERCPTGFDGLEARQVLEQPGERFGDDHPDFLPEAAQRDGERERRAEAVGVRVLVREACDPVGVRHDPADGVDDVLETWPDSGGCDGHSGTSTTSSAGRSPARPLRSVLTLTLYAIDSSSSKWSRGTLRRFSSRLPS